MSTKSLSKFAFVTLLMKGDKYLPGVIALHESVLENSPGVKNNTIDFVCMVTNDVSDNAISMLSKLKIKLVKVEYITHNVTNMITKKQDKMYSSWIGDSFTKWNCLNLTQYQKIFLLDADTIIIDNLDHVFDFPTPCAIFSSPWSDTYQKESTIKDSYKNIKKLDKYIKDIESCKVSADIINNVLNNNKKENTSFVCYASSILLEPNEHTFINLKIKLSKYNCYGFKCYSGFDEQLIAQILSEKGFYNLSQNYGMIPWKKEWLINDRPVYVYHYFNTVKPWDMKENDWPDLIPWFNYYNKALNKLKS